MNETKLSLLGLKGEQEMGISLCGQALCAARKIFTAF
jgi:hypothetical protein